MTRFLLDSGIANDYLNRQHGVYERARAELAKGNRIGIGTPVLGELISASSAAPVGKGTSSC